MVKSKLCNLRGLSPRQLVEHHEEAEVTHVYTTTLIAPTSSVFVHVFESFFFHHTSGNGRLFHCKW